MKHWLFIILTFFILNSCKNAINEQNKNENPILGSWTSNSYKIKKLVCGFKTSENFNENYINPIFKIDFKKDNKFEITNQENNLKNGTYSFKKDSLELLIENKKWNNFKIDSIKNNKMFITSSQTTIVIKEDKKTLLITGREVTFILERVK